MTSDSERDDSGGTQPASEPKPTLDPKKPPAAPDPRIWQDKPADGDPESGEAG
jgi:hypothetical protein